VDALYSKPMLWAETCLHNIAGMGKFSTDRSIIDYAKNVWNIEPFKPDPDIFERVSNDFKAADQCRIY